MKWLLALLLAASFSGCTASVLERPDDAVAQPFAFFHRHDFRGAAERVTFEIEREIDVRMESWYEGAFRNEDPLAIRLLAPDGRMHAGTTTPASYSSAEPRTFHAMQALRLTPGTWTVSFEGSGQPVGFAQLREG